MQITADQPHQPLIALPVCPLDLSGSAYDSSDLFLQHAALSADDARLFLDIVDSEPLTFSRFNGDMRSFLARVDLKRRNGEREL